MEVVRLGLVEADRDLTIPNGATTMLRKDGLRKSPVSYLDFTVDGERLLDRLNVVAGSRLDKVGEVCRRLAARGVRAQ